MNKAELWDELKLYLTKTVPSLCVGRDNMFKLLERYKPEWVKLHRWPMPNNDEEGE